jgi:hypothetical protein
MSQIIQQSAHLSHAGTPRDMKRKEARTPQNPHFRAHDYEATPSLSKEPQMITRTARAVGIHEKKKKIISRYLL